MRSGLGFVLAVLCSLLWPVFAGHLPSPPSAPQIPVTETIHGVSVTDNYRWLEDQNSPQTRAWIGAQQKYTAAFFEGLSDRGKVRASLDKIERVESVSVPWATNGRYFFTRRLASEEQASLLVRTGIEARDEVLVNPNTLFPDHSVSVSIADVSRDGKILAYRFRKGGQDETEIHFLNVSSKKDLPDILPRAVYFVVSRYAFDPDKASFYYARFSPAGTHVYRHNFGDAISKDQEIFGSGYGPDYVSVCGITSTAKYLFCQASKGASSVEGDLYVEKRGEKTLRPIAQHMPLILEVAPYRDHLFVFTRWQAPNGRVLDIDLDQPSSGNWKEVIHDGANPISDVSIAGGKMFATTLENVSSHCSVYKLDGSRLGEIKLPALGTLFDLEGEEDGPDAFVQFSSFAYPTSILKIEPNDTTAIWWRMAVPIAVDQFQIKQVWYASKDGTKIPMFIVSKRGQTQGSRPALLTGYGGFDVPLVPHWSPLVGWWVNQGGIYAVPALRGGGEFGEAWHRAGMFEKKQNVFDDFVGAAEYLIQSGLTSRDKLGIFGGSNGGLLVGAAMTQRPDLFSAVVCVAPLLDMVRYQKFKTAKLWVSEYGSSDDPMQFKYIYRYSPYHHVEKSARYPAVLFVSGDSDTRVDPLHARKMAALMQSAAATGKPILLRYDTLLGHSGGMSIDRQIDLDTDVLAFLKSQIG